MPQKKLPRRRIYPLEDRRSLRVYGAAGLPHLHLQGLHQLHNLHALRVPALLQVVQLGIDLLALVPTPLPQVEDGGLVSQCVEIVLLQLLHLVVVVGERVKWQRMR